jgi:Family of unknown function (DUF6064)
MSLPFTQDQFFEVFRRYNEAVWPAQAVLMALALLAVLLAVRGTSSAARVVSGILAILWLWMAVVYHWAFFTSINRAAVLFGVLFMGQGILFAVIAFRKSTLLFDSPGKLRRLMGAAVIGYALLIYPALGALLGHRFPASPTFGLPCPTTIFTFGLLLWAGPSVPRVALAIPLFWAGIGTWGAVSLGVREDYGLAVAALMSAILLVRAKPVPPIAISKPAHIAALR